MSEPKSRTIGSHHSVNTHCKVCGDRASGKHYGVPSCDGCRGFFKRSIRRRNLEYACKEGGKCIVDVSRRNQCQACRFAKCIAANMRPEAVQHERAPRSCVPNPHLNGLAGRLERGIFTSPQHVPLHSHHHHHPHHSHNGLVLPMPIHLPTAFSSEFEPQLQRHYAQFGAIHSNMFDSFSHFAAAANSKLFPQPAPPPPPLIPTNSSFIPKSSSDPKRSPIFSSLNHASDMFATISGQSHSDPIIPSSTIFSVPKSKSKSSIDGKEDEVSSSEEISTFHSNLLNRSGSTSPNNQEILFETAAKLLFLAVKWTKSIQSFTQLNVNDQNILLEECWAELFVIMSAQYGLPIGNLMISSNDISIHKLYKAIHQILLLRLNHTEIACLKTLTLFRPDCVGLTSPYEIAMLQDESLNLLLESCGGATRMGHILLILPYIRAAADRKVIQEVLFKKTVGEVAIEKLLGDLIRN